MLLLSGRIAPTRHWHMPLHVHADYDELILVVAGGIETKIAASASSDDFLTLTGTAGSILHYPSGRRHVERAIGGAPLETLFISYRAPRGSDIPLVSTDPAGHLLHAARWMLALCSTRDAADRAAAESILAAVLHELSAARRKPENDLVRRVQRYVEYHLADLLTLDKLSEEAGMSKFHFSRAFSRAAGMSPMAYVRQARVNAARTLLRSSALPLRGIARLVGFSDQTQLSRTFRRLTGRTPGEYRSGVEYPDKVVQFGAGFALPKPASAKRR